MDINKFITKSLQDTQIKPQTTNITSLLPEPQKNRSYADLETKVVDKLFITPERFFFGKDRTKKNWIMKYRLQWNFRTGSQDRKKTSQKQLNDFAKEWMLSLSHRGDEKYIQLTRMTDTWMEFRFNHEKWLNDNFRSNKAKFMVPNTLRFKFKNSIPRMIYAHASLLDLKSFLEDRYKLYMTKHSRELKNKAFKFLTKITPDMFIYTLDLRDASMKVALKYSVIIGSLALYSMYKHGKDMSKGEVKKIKRDVSRMSDVKSLDKYLTRKK